MMSGQWAIEELVERRRGCSLASTGETDEESGQRVKVAGGVLTAVGTYALYSA